MIEGVSYKVGYGAEVEEPVKKLTRVLLDSVKAVKEQRMVFFETLDDPHRLRPVDAADALTRSQRILDTMFDLSEVGAFTWEADFFFRLLAFVAVENPFLCIDDTTVPLMASAAKACIGLYHGAEAGAAGSNAARTACWRALSHLTNNVAGTVQSSHTCTKCTQPLGTGRHH